MQRVNIKGAVSQKNVISGVVHKGGNGDRRSDHYFATATNTYVKTVTILTTYIKNEEVIA